VVRKDELEIESDGFADGFRVRPDNHAVLNLENAGCGESAHTPSVDLDFGDTETAGGNFIYILEVAEMRDIDPRSMRHLKNRFAGICLEFTIINGNCYFLCFFRHR
jgi:hypothetical protein